VKPGGAQPVTDGGKTQVRGNGSGVGILVNEAESRQGTSTDSLRTHRKNSHEENKHGPSAARSNLRADGVCRTANGRSTEKIRLGMDLWARTAAEDNFRTGALEAAAQFAGEIQEERALTCAGHGKT
jgi:hypothetical protein